MKNEKQDIYRFFAIFTEVEKIYEVEFPDLENCFTFGENFEEAYQNAKDVLGLVLFDMEEENIEITQATAPIKIKIKENQFLMPVEIYMPIVRNELNLKVDKKTLTVPHWLNKLAMDKKINFSQVLQVALKKELNIE